MRRLRLTVMSIRRTSEVSCDSHRPEKNQPPEQRGIAQGRGHQPASAARGASGFSMIELLVALALLTMAIVGLAQLQGTALKLSHGAYLRSQANNLIYDIVDSMRANRAAALDEAYVWDLGDPAPSAAAAAASVALSDIRQWLFNIENSMRPYQGTGGVVQDGRRITVTISWIDRVDSEKADDGQQHTDNLTVVTEL